MLVSVVSPHSRGNGNTITAMLLALGLGDMRKKVLLTHTEPMSEPFFTYFGLQQYEDKTSTPTQLVKLLREEAIKPEELTDYCKSVTDGVDVFTNNKTNFTEEDMYSFTKYILQMSEYDYIVYDVSDMKSDTATLVIKQSDIIIFNLTQSVIELKEFEKQKESLMKMCQDKQVILVCNKFSPVIGKVTDITKKLKLKTVCRVIHYNSKLIWACNAGKLLTFYDAVKKKWWEAIELDKDIVGLATLVSKAKIATLKQKQQESKGKVGGAK